MKTINSRATLAIGAICLFFGVFPPIKSEISSRNSLTNDEVYTIIKKTNEAFDLAEKTVLKTDPSPDDNPSGPHPDVDKCACRGTGNITHGDGHQTDCPYHGKNNPEPNDTNECTGCKCDTKRTYCNCVKAYGKCSCKKRRRIVNFGVR